MTPACLVITALVAIGAESSAQIAGLDSDREGGRRLVELAAKPGGPAQANALFSLIVIYNQQSRFDDALAVIATLQQKYPRNRLLWLEAATTQLRAGNPAGARASLEHGLRMLDSDPRPRAFGELSRWRHSYGVSLAALNEPDAARHQFTIALQTESLDWVRQQIRVELSRLAPGRK